MRELRTRHRHSHISTGLFLIGLGCLFLAERQGYLDREQLINLWPGLLTLVGLSQMIGARHAGEVFRGAFLVFVSGWLYVCIQHLWGLNFYNSWPLLLIAAGVAKVLGGLFRMQSQDEENLP
ncbi:DUF5668 domain-containing protein [Paucibacter sp. APW11]|uniref:DUF5668 domain-containing protein n=1 Tax=Roseateles aquae TaxID=3077235 RepID=A0ABU3PDV4_9BURK|nr:DUF5668 domain-containing protein [Paucibacter sp. APW11]MDT9000760.1 DUF5668 domain-containing protein [Paucibacter sp. APW11]